MSEKLLEVKDLTVQFNTTPGIVRAVNGVSFDLESGDVLGMVGETGAGKSTTALSILRLIPNPPGKIPCGEILFQGQDLLKVSEAEMRKIRGGDIAMIFQDPMTALNPVVRIEDQIAEALFTHQLVTKQDAMKKTHELLERVGIAKVRGGDFPHQLSGGMKQRVVIAMALACNPKLIIADEPTTALDVTIQAQILDMMRSLTQDLGTSMILITHDLGVVAETCNKVVIMYAGEVVEQGSLEDIFDRTAHPYTQRLFEALPSLDKKVDMLNPIEGLMPDSIDLPKGCKFNPRCSLATEECRKDIPEMKELTKGHFVRCIKCTALQEENRNGR
ncbi:MAG: ABC transporter ATP-binding protein [Parasporobacterium sp.]|nr:ABC transporter ATP-binding protein [Parasporobacterium sp.]